MRLQKREYVACIESALRNLKDETGVNLARAKISTLLNNTKRPERNLSPGETTALNDLVKTDDVVIVPADKGKAVVLLDLDDYVQKAKDLIDQPPFQRVKKDPTKCV